MSLIELVEEVFTNFQERIDKVAPMSWVLMV
ncbi:hypothetical protein SAMN05877842_1158 [Ureibacillus acetophenoni]|uniref:Uncharacterized protein n=1 Tax=Ureibacillus acetophenoni TaxID=614649 RepID=A0A285UMZ8_9BACL|nr:hypothetical protein SAMN05877842_1158 [Ureibacillus acetophenoni]